MAEDIGALVVRIEANLNNLEKGLQQAEQKANKFGGTIKSIGGVIAGAFVVDKIVEFGKKSIQLASDLQEVQNVVDVTFGEGAKQIDSWAKTTLNAFGLSELQAKQFSGTMGAMLKSSGLAGDEVINMSTRLTELAGDMSSFYNLPHDVAWEKIRSGISGETEPLKQLGINMSVANLEAFALSQGINKSWKEMTQAEQVTLRYNYLMQTTKDTQGDFTRTQDGFANQLRLVTQNFEQLIASIAVKFLPILTKALQWVNEGIKVFSDGGGAIKNVFGGSIDEVTKKILPPLISIFNTIKDDIIPLLVKAFQAAWPTIKELVSNSVGVMIDVVGGLLKAINGLLNFIVGVFTGDWKRAWNGVKDIFKGIWDSIAAIFKGAINRMIININGFIRGINKIKLPDFLGGGGVNIPLIPKLAKGTNFVPFDTAAFLHKGEAVVPADNNPSNPSANNPVGQAINYAGMFDGAVFNVRSDNDIKLLAREIFNLQQNRSRSSGVVYAT